MRLVWVAAPPRLRDVLRLAPSSTTTRCFAGELGLPTLERFALHDGRARPRPRRLPADPGAPVAVASAAGGDVRRRRRAAAAGVPRPRRRRVPRRSSRSARSSTSPSPTRHYVKTALSVVNMGFVRGLSAAYMEGTPAINDWVADLLARRRGAGRVAHRAPARARRRRLPQRALRGRRRAGLAVPEDARRAVAREPGPAARARRAARDDGVAAARRPRRPLARGGADRALGAEPPTGCGATSTPTCGRCCTASTPTTSCSCRTARTSSSCSRTTSRGASCSRTSPRRSC